MVNAERIEEMKRLSAEATSGPWVSETKGMFGQIRIASGGYKYVGCGISENLLGDILGDVNAKFIAKSRQFVPDIIAAYEAQAEEIKRLRIALELADYGIANIMTHIQEGNASHAYVLAETHLGATKEALAWRNTTRK